ncbi:MAG: hypothetical protein HN403_11135 [Rhodospirillales bacterium]|nr:hypothetical protein [Rhodospirillales bacterium]
MSSPSRFDVSAAKGLCAIDYAVSNAFENPIRVWVFASPVGARKRFGATASAFVGKVLAPGESSSVQLNLPRWVSQPLSHRVIVIATGDATPGKFAWIDQGLRGIESAFDFARWADLRERIKSEGLILLSAFHEINH